MNTTTTTQSPSHQQTWELPEIFLRLNTPSTLETLAQGFDPISLAQMDAVALLNRTDTKFVMPQEQLFSTLAALQNDYWMLSVEGQRLNHYRTLYFDTFDFALYHLHVNERPDRYKVRSREYTDSRLSFFEVKHKTSKDRTIKTRIPTLQPVVEMTREAEMWLRKVCPLDGQELQPKLWNTFTRLTLVSKQFCERVTLDIDLTFFTPGQVVHLNGLAIAEVKMDSCRGASPFMNQMRAQKIHPNGFSKYAIGVSMLYDQVKKNPIKAKLLWLERMMAAAM